MATSSEISTRPSWQTVAIYGVGLIGGSIGMGLRQRGLAKQVIGVGRNSQRLEKAQQLGAIDSYTTHPSEVQADIVVLCAPVELVATHCAQISAACPDALITDAGSTKQQIVRRIETELPAAKFVGSHPLAGSDRSGVEHSQGELLQDRMVVLTPTERTEPAWLDETQRFWQALGARTCCLDPAAHDQALALSSHLPHVVASALAAVTPADVLHLVAGGWRDSTRIAAADVELWRQILTDNAGHVLDAVHRMQAQLAEFETALTEHDHDSITRLLAAGKQRRDALGS